MPGLRAGDEEEWLDCKGYATVEVRILFVQFDDASTRRRPDADPGWSVRWLPGSVPQSLSGQCDDGYALRKRIA